MNENMSNKKRNFFFRHPNLTAFGLCCIVGMACSFFLSLKYWYLKSAPMILNDGLFLGLFFVYPAVLTLMKTKTACDIVYIIMKPLEFFS